MAADWDTSGIHDGRTFNEREARPRRGRFDWLGSRRRRYGLITGLVSLAIVGAFIWSGSDREGAAVGEDPPMIRTGDAPIRVPPEDPGGMEIPHQDKLVYQRSPGEAEDLKMERLLPPPEEPMAPPAREPASAAMEPVVPLPSEANDAASTSAEAFPPPGSETPSRTSSFPPPRPKEVAREQHGREPAGDAAQATVPAPPPVTASAEQRVATDGPRRLLPSEAEAPASASARPSRSATPSTATAMVVAPPPAATGAGPRTGGYMVQLLAVGSAEQAKAAWGRLKGANADLLGQLSPAYVRADLGSRGVIYRLRAGPVDGETRARALCAQLTGRNVDCMIVSPSG